MDTFSEFKFVSTYYIAAHVREKIITNDPKDYVSDYFDIAAQEQQFLQQSKHTLLHGFIKQEFILSVEYWYKFFSSNEMVNEGRKYLDNHKIEYPNYLDFLKNGGYTEDEEENDFFDEYGLKLSDIVIDKVAPLVANEVFSILFRDRKLLLEFNKLLAEIITDLEVVNYPNLLAKDGIVKRCLYWPEWVKRALMYRDQGSCAICLNDISGLLKVNFDKAIDHIVPLKLGGTNDITNLQILCEACNLKKLDHTIITSEMYSAYF